jgi:ribose transport system permease protein
MTGTAIGRWLVRQRPLVMLAVVVVAMSVGTSGFLTGANLENLVVQSAAAGIIAVGMTVVLIGGGFDLSVGSTMALTGVVTVALLGHGLVVALAGGIAVGAVIGLCNGILVTKAKINPFIATLATMIVVRGLALLAAGGQPTFADSPAFDQLGNGEVLGLPAAGIYVVAAFLIVWLITRYTVYGRDVYAVGGNEKAARMAGLDSTRVRTWTYIIGGITAALAGILVGARLNVASPTIGDDAALAGITAALLGGTSLYGGIGSVIGTLEGLLLIAVLGNGLNLLGVPAAYQTLATGLVLIVAVLLETLTHGHAQRNIISTTRRLHKTLAMSRAR